MTLIDTRTPDAKRLMADAVVQAQSATTNGDGTPSMDSQVDTGVDYLGY